MTEEQDYEALMAASYDGIYAKLRDPVGDRAFYLDLARASGGPVLELGCGTGRTLLPIAEEGIVCVGLDSSAAMLDVLQRKNPPANLSLVRGSMESFSLGEGRFALITAPFRAFGHLLDVEAQLATLAQVRRHLKPDGVFALDLFDPRLDMIAAVESPEFEDAAVEHDGVHWRRWARVRRDHTRQVLHVTFRIEGSDGRRGSTELSLRWFYRFELEHLLHRAGFSQLEFFGDFRGARWKAGGETVIVARR